MTIAARTSLHVFTAASSPIPVARPGGPQALPTGISDGDGRKCGHLAFFRAISPEKYDSPPLPAPRAGSGGRAPGAGAAGPGRARGGASRADLREAGGLGGRAGMPGLPGGRGTGRLRPGGDVRPRDVGGVSPRTDRAGQLGAGQLGAGQLEGLGAGQLEDGSRTPAREAALAALADGYGWKGHRSPAGACAAPALGMDRLPPPPPPPPVPSLPKQLRE